MKVATVVELSENDVKEVMAGLVRGKLMSFANLRAESGKLMTASLVQNYDVKDVSSALLDKAKSKLPKDWAGTSAVEYLLSEPEQTAGRGAEPKVTGVKVTFHDQNGR
jgi:hypothetical protein